MRKFSGFQKRVLATCFMVYICTYVGRLNMSATLQNIIEQFKISDSVGGTLQTGWAVAYAGGQLLFGNIADRFEPKKLILAGLSGSALCNLLFSFGQTFWQLQIMWTLNGVFQSMIWTPIVLYMAYSFEPEKRSSASFVMSFTLALGNLAAWALAMVMEMLLSWRWSYRIPTAVMIAAAAAAMLLLPGDIREKAQKEHVSAAEKPAPLRELVGTGLFMLLLCCVMNGFVRDGVMTWAPTMLSEISESTWVFKLFIPIINLPGIVAARLLLDRITKKNLHINIRALVGLLMGVLILPSLVLGLSGKLPAALTALLLGILSAMLFGTNPLLTTMIPMQFDSYGRVGMVAGLIDCFIYLGSALSGTVTGAVHDACSGWSYVYLVWGAAMLAGFALAAISSKAKKMR